MFGVGGSYRYLLWRRWDSAAPRLLFIGLNPSTADAAANDPTIRRMLTRARREGYGTLLVANLYAARATRPRDLEGNPWPGGPQNDLYLRLALAEADRVVAAWGAHRMAPAAADAVVALARRAGKELWCLGTTRDGWPRHPLYVPNSQALVPWVPSPDTRR